MTNILCMGDATCVALSGVVPEGDAGVAPTKALCAVRTSVAEHLRQSKRSVGKVVFKLVWFIQLACDISNPLCHVSTDCRCVSVSDCMLDYLTNESYDMDALLT